MSNETKRDVLKKALDFFVMCGIEQSINYGLERYQYLSEYDAALPDDLPVIPELIGKYLKMWKHNRGNLFEAFDEGTSANLDGTKWESVQDWFIDAKDSFDTFALAWVLGVWRVEETSEIVKLRRKNEANS